MKKLIILTAILVMVTVLSGCLATLHPLFTEKDLVFDARLLGIWREGNNKELTTIERGTVASFGQLPEKLRSLADRAYVLTHKDDSEEKKYYGFLTRIGKELYLDFYPLESKAQLGYDRFYMQHLVKMHRFYSLRFFNEDSFAIREFDGDFLKELIDKNQIRLKHEKRFNGDFVITASTQELQQYVQKYSDVDEAYSSSTVLVKQRQNIQP
jgi:hypothetical protein